MDLTNIHEEIRKQLPEELGQTLRSELEELEKARRRVKHLEGQVSMLKEELEELEGLKGEEERLEEWGESLRKQSLAQKSDSQRLDLREQVLELRETHSQEKVDFARDLVTQVFRSPIVRRSGTVPQVIPSTDDYVGHVTSGHLDVTEEEQ